MTTRAIGLLGVPVFTSDPLSSSTAQQGCGLFKSQAYEIIIQYAPLCWLPAPNKRKYVKPTVENSKENSITFNGMDFQPLRSHLIT
jgi:hypothetical protein